jgi:predicted RND superfamily exporter protein
MEETLVRSGSGIITGALTTAVAFFALAVSSTRGIKEMGIVLGMGILSAMITTVAGLPAFLVARERVVVKVTRRPVRVRNIEFSALGRLGEMIMRRPGVFLAIGVVLTGFFVFQSSRAKFDSNMLNLEPKGMVSVALYDTIIEAFDLSPDFAMVMANSIEESWEVAERAKDVPVISAVDNIGDVLPPMELQRERQPHVVEIRKAVESSPVQISLPSGDVEGLIAELERLDMNIYELSQLAFIGGQDKVDKKARELIGDVEIEGSKGMILRLAQRIGEDPERAADQLSMFSEYYWPTLQSRLSKMANPEFITLDMLPEHIRTRYINDDGTKFLVTMYPAEQVWNFESLRRFNAQIEQVSPRVTGTPALMLRLLRYIGRDGMRATLLTFGVVLLLLWVDFRSLKFALLGVIPLIAGGVWMAGLLQSFGMMFTVINVTAIPMIVGIGIDDAVHVLHRYRVEGLDQTPVVLKSTGKAVLLTSLTTMAGFGSLMTARYTGFVGLGAVLVLGVGSCFLTTILFIPSIIGLGRRKKQQG